MPTGGAGEGGFKSEYRLDGRVVTWEAYSASLAGLGILVKVRNFLCFQVGAPRRPHRAAGCGSRLGCGARRVRRPRSSVSAAEAAAMPAALPVAATSPSRLTPPHPQGDIEAVAAKSPAGLTALFEQVSGSEALRARCEELGAAKGAAEEKVRAGAGGGLGLEAAVVPAQPRSACVRGGGTGAARRGKWHVRLCRSCPQVALLAARRKALQAEVKAKRREAEEAERHAAALEAVVGAPCDVLLYAGCKAGLVQGKCPRLLQAYHQLLGFGRLGQSRISFASKANLSRLAALVSGGHVELAGGVQLAALPAGCRRCVQKGLKATALALECLSAGRNETQHTVDEGRDWRHWATPANLQQQQDQHPEWRLFGAVAPELDH